MFVPTFMSVSLTGTFFISLHQNTLSRFGFMNLASDARSKENLRSVISNHFCPKNPTLKESACVRNFRVCLNIHICFVHSGTSKLRGKQLAIFRFAAI